MFRLAVCLTLVMTIGCSKPAEFQRAEVGGAVSVDGQPLAEGTISFYPDVKVKGSLVQAKIVEGKFTFSKNDGPALGAHRVSISAAKKTGKKVSVEGVESEEIVESIPWQYNLETSLTADVKPSPAKNDFKFELKSQALPRNTEGGFAAP